MASEGKNLDTPNKNEKISSNEKLSLTDVIGKLSPEELILLNKYRNNSDFAKKINASINDSEEGNIVEDLNSKEYINSKKFIDKLDINNDYVYKDIEIKTEETEIINIEKIKLFGKDVLQIKTGFDGYVILREADTFSRVIIPAGEINGTFSGSEAFKNKILVDISGHKIFNYDIVGKGSMLVNKKGEEVKLFLNGTSEKITRATNLYTQEISKILGKEIIEIYTQNSIHRLVDGNSLKPIMIKGTNKCIMNYIRSNDSLPNIIYVNYVTTEHDGGSYYRDDVAQIDCNTLEEIKILNVEINGISK